jgi:hypothetical protein
MALSTLAELPRTDRPTDSTLAYRQVVNNPPRSGIGIRLFLTCWIVYCLHFSSNIVREIYPALALGDHLSFRVDEYAHMHPDLFEKEGYGWHIGNNPGASIVGAVPYALLRPIIDPIVQAVLRNRAASGLTEPPAYESPWPMAREFYSEAWRRGLDIKFGLGAFVMQTLAMAPTSALGALLMFGVMRYLVPSERWALFLALLYAFGTPVFFRTGYLNQNLMLGHAAFFGFVVLWNPTNSSRFSTRPRYLIGGLAGGFALLCDYSGLVLLAGLLFYGTAKRFANASLDAATRAAGWFLLGALPPILMLWFYQWNSFGNPFLPGQHWMPAVEWIDRGYQGFGLPQLDLILALAFDHRFGLVVSCPLLVLALIYLVRAEARTRRLPRLELTFLLAVSAVFLLFFSGSNYTRLQFNTGIRYMSAILPFLYIPAALTLVRLPRIAIGLITVFSLTESWCLAMYRDVESPFGVLNPVLHVFFGGFQLPLLTVLSRMGSAYGDFTVSNPSPLPLFALAGALVFVLWDGPFLTRAPVLPDR